MVGDIDIFDLFHTATEANKARRHLHNEYFDLFNDFLICSDEVIYFIAHLYLYQPYINNPLKDGHIFYDSEVFPNRQNIPSKRYSMFADVTAQKIYNFWDRIGDLLATYLPEPPTERVYFVNVIEKIPSRFRQSEHYNWLVDAKQRHYLELNKLRKSIVHHSTTDTLFTKRHLKAASNREEMKKLMEERLNYPVFYQDQNEKAIEGFIRALRLIQEMDPSE